MQYTMEEIMEPSVKSVVMTDVKDPVLEMMESVEDMEPIKESEDDGANGGGCRGNEGNNRNNRVILGHGGARG